MNEMFAPYTTFSNSKTKPETEDTNNKLPSPPTVDPESVRIRQALHSNNVFPCESVVNAARYMQNLSTIEKAKSLARQNLEIGGTCYLPKSAHDKHPNVCQYIGGKKQRVRRVCIIPKTSCSQKQLSKKGYRYADTPNSYIVGDVDRSVCDQYHKSQFKDIIECSGDAITQQTCGNYITQSQDDSREYLTGAAIQSDYVDEYTGVPCDPNTKNPSCRNRCLDRLNESGADTNKREWSATSDEEGNLVFSRYSHQPLKPPIPTRHKTIDAKEQSYYSPAVNTRKCVLTGQNCPSYVLPETKKSLENVRLVMIVCGVLLAVFVGIIIYLLCRKRKRRPYVMDIINRTQRQVPLSLSLSQSNESSPNMNSVKDTFHKLRERIENII